MHKKGQEGSSFEYAQKLRECTFKLLCPMQGGIRLNLQLFLTIGYRLSVCAAADHDTGARYRMRLTTVHIEKFRGLCNVRLDLCSMTLLIGENNSGKTSVLDAIRLALSRAAGRKTGTFEPYDYHLGTPEAEPQSADPISVTLTFAADAGEVLPDEFTQMLGDALVTDDVGRPFVIFRVTSTFDATLNDFVADWQFMDTAGNPLGPKSKRPSILQDFQRLFPVFYLSAFRDAVREFRTGSFWTPFIKNPAMKAAASGADKRAEQGGSRRTWFAKNC